MTACGICGGFDYRHDPVAHGEGGDDEADYRRDGDQAIDALAASIRDRQEERE